jgi:L-seryl-tRNA(Ser) seleniumtransferase
VLNQLAETAGSFPRALVINEIRRVIEQHRAEIRAGSNPEPHTIPARVSASLEALLAPSFRNVINATGVVLHTNLGRAPLPEFTPLTGYSNVEYDIASGKRGKRDVHIAPLIERLLGVPGIAVNNNAAAIYLALAEFAQGHEVIVSRGELIEIGDGFRIPEIMKATGAVLREVGTTNRTTIDDYRDAIGERTRLLLRVHPSNFRIEGFTGKPSLEALANLSRDSGIPLYEDLGSGCVADLRGFGVDEPLVSESVRAGVDLISFSGDKLLGGPQAGILAGKPELISRIRRNPMYRALRLDKLILQSLEHTLRLLLLERWDEIPALQMLRQSAEEIRARAQRLLARVPLPNAALVEGRSVIGGGSTPGQSLPTWLISIPESWEQQLRLGSPPVIGRIEEGRLLLDLRTVLANQEQILADCLQRLPGSAGFDPAEAQG